MSPRGPPPVSSSRRACCSCDASMTPSWGDPGPVRPEPSQEPRRGVRPTAELTRSVRARDLKMGLRGLHPRSPDCSLHNLSASDSLSERSGWPSLCPVLPRPTLHPWGPAQPVGCGPGQARHSLRAQVPLRRGGRSRPPAKRTSDRVCRPPLAGEGKRKADAPWFQVPFFRGHLEATAYFPR